MIYLPKYLSYTSIDLWSRCPSCWYNKYVLKKRGYGSGALLFGHVMSKALERIHTGVLVDEAWTSSWEEFPDREQVAYGFEKGIELVREYEKHGIYAGKPETYFEINIQGIEIPIIGYIDLDQEAGIVEFKTSRVTWDQRKCDMQMQATIYLLAHSKDLGIASSFHGCRYVILTTSECAKVQTFDTRRSEIDFSTFEQRVQQVWSEMKDGIYPAICSGCRNNNVTKVSPKIEL